MRDGNVCPGMIHGFANMSAVLDGGRCALDDSAWLRSIEVEKRVNA